MKSSLIAFIALSISGFAEAETYYRSESLSGQSLLDAFFWQNIKDPTNGRVNYVDLETAQSKGMVSVYGNTLTLRADDTSYLDPSGPGRDSFRLMSYKQYTKHVAIICPKVVEHGRHSSSNGNWPNDGEIDILEGVNDKSPNQATLHTSPGCEMEQYRWMSGTSVNNDCDVYVNYNEGCGVRFSDWDSFGPGFNNNGGGWYAMDRGNYHIAIYFWGRNDPNVPSEVKYAGETVTPVNWGTPKAYFKNDLCNFQTHFGPLNYIFNLDFCGDWAGSAYASDGCPGNCVDFVNNNPRAFSDAYFEFNSMTTYGP